MSGFSTKMFSFVFAALACYVAPLAGAELDAARKERLHQRLNDASPSVRKQAALTLAEANDADAIPVLIDLLAELPADERRPIEEFLSKLAGEWTPLSQFNSEDKIARRIRRDAWRAWWRDTDGQALLGIVEEYTATPEVRRKIHKWIDNLHNNEFALREEAAAELEHLGRLALPQLREARASKNAETARSARQLVERIEREPGRSLPLAAVRLLGLRKPDGATAALLAYSPLAEEENAVAEIGKALAVLALRDGKLDADLLRALKDAKPDVRAAAAEAVVKGGGKAGRQAVQPLLRDDAATVRLRLALALALAGDKNGVPVLIDLLAVLPDEHVGRAEAALCQLAGDSAPETPLGTEAADKKKCRDAWAAWWKVNAGRIDMARLTDRPSLGYTVICDINGNRVYEIDRAGKQRWTIQNVRQPMDAVVVPGQRVLIAEYGGSVSERDFQGKVVWQRQMTMPACVQRLPNGNTFMAGRNQLLEVDRAGKEVYSIRMPNTVNAAYRSRQGSIVCLLRTNQCALMDTTGKQLSSFASNHGGNMYGGLDVSPTGHILVTRRGQNKVAEFDRDGKTLREVDAPGATTATALPNGHLLIANQQEQRVYELNRAGKVVWEHKNAGQVFRARRR
jgi:HEAT repeat protein